MVNSQACFHGIVYFFIFSASYNNVEDYDYY